MCLVKASSPDPDSHPEGLSISAMGGFIQENTRQAGGYSAPTSA